MQKEAIMNIDDFPELKSIQANWEIIRDEVKSLKEQGFFDRRQNNPPLVTMI